jgi:predicted metal-binding membrane protein
MSWFPILLAVHIVLAVALLLPSVALPFVLRRGRSEQGPVARALMAMQGTGTLVIGAGLALTGGAMLWILGPQLVTQPWLMAALVLYALNLGIAGFVSRPNLRRLIGLDASQATDATWRRRARQQRYVAYGMAGLIGVIGFLMSTKPDLW